MNNKLKIGDFGAKLVAEESLASKATVSYL